MTFKINRAAISRLWLDWAVEYSRPALPAWPQRPRRLRGPTGFLLPAAQRHALGASSGPFNPDAANTLKKAVAAVNALPPAAGLHHHHRRSAHHRTMAPSGKRMAIVGGGRLFNIAGILLTLTGAGVWRHLNELDNEMCALMQRRRTENINEALARYGFISARAIPSRKL